MKLIRVTLDDYDQPLIGVLAVNDDKLERTLALLQEANTGDAFVVDVTEPDSLDDVLTAMQQITAD